MGRSGGSIRVLHVDDEPELRSAVKRHLEREHDDIVVTTERCASDGLETLSREPVDCIVSDHGMDGMDGLAFLRAVRSDFSDLPFVLFTGKGNESIASEAISAGVTEYLQKGDGTDQYTVLANRIERAVSENRTKAALERQKQRHSTLVSNLPGMVYRCRNERGWPMTFVSDGARDLTGYDASEIENGAVSWEEDILHPEDRDRIWDEVQTALAASEPFEVTYRITTKDGKRRWVWERGRIVAREDETEVLEGFITDITVRKERERELRRYETILQAVGDPVYTVDEAGVFTIINDAMETLSGYDQGDLIGEHISQVMTPTGVHDGEELIADLLANEDRANGTFEMDIVTADGEEIPCENHIALLTTEDGAFRGTAGVIRDITDRKQRERRLEQFASVVSHDLRSPLTVVQGRLDHVIQTGETAHLEDAADAARRMERLIEDLLTLAREGQRVGEKKSVAVDVVAEEAWDSLQTGDATLTIDTTAQVEADCNRLRELFENLFANAIEHGGPSVTVQVLDTDAGFAVADDGDGIPNERHDDVFERGFTTSDDGTGFGLAIVDTIVQAHDWSISASESTAGGARFDIET